MTSTPTRARIDTPGADHPGATHLQLGGPAHAALVSRISRGLEARWPGDTPETLDAMCRHALVPAGKLFRPLLLLECAIAAGGNVEAALPAALGAESGHVGSLVHDDIIDDDDLRRGRPSVQHRYGVGPAIVAGDALIFDLFANVAACAAAGAAATRVVQAIEVIAGVGIDLCRGQSLEHHLTTTRSFDLELYLNVARLKTASYFRCVCQVGALLGNADTATVSTLGEFGELVGCAFQYRDDLLGYTSTSATTGKPAGSDIKNGRITLPVVLAHHLSTATVRAEISQLLFDDAQAPVGIDRITHLVARSGALEQAMIMADDAVDRARTVLHTLPASPARDRLDTLARLASRRQH